MKWGLNRMFRNVSTVGNKNWPSMTWSITECPQPHSKEFSSSVFKGFFPAFRFLQSAAMMLSSPETTCSSCNSPEPASAKKVPRDLRRCRSSGTKYGAQKSLFCSMGYLRGAGQWTLLKFWLVSTDSLQIASCDYLQAREKQKLSSCFLIEIQLISVFLIVCLPVWYNIYVGIFKRHDAACLCLK